MVRTAQRPVALQSAFTRVCAFAGICALLAMPLRAADEPTATAVGPIGITVADGERSLAFYRDVLGFEPVSDTEVAGEEHARLAGVFGARLRVIRARLGAEEIELVDFLAPEGKPFPPDTRANDLWFQHIAIVVRDMREAYEHLRRHRVAHASTAPQRLPDWNAAAGGIEAFYFRDPDGHHLEVIRFPPGKGDPRWQEPAERPFLGIDHTAIVVADTDASLAFYRDTLGLRVAGESENHGSEQERLNNVFGARLRITTLRAAAGPGIELLEYLAPRGGRPRPLAAAANDLLFWQTSVLVGDAGCAERATRAAKAAWISPGVVALPGRELGFARALLVADPDGHAVRFVEAPGEPGGAGPGAGVRSGS